jgi:lysozyme
MRTASEKCIDFICEMEGFRGKVYQCPAGFDTIGYGHRLCEGETMRAITREQARKLMRSDLAKIEENLNYLFPDDYLTDCQYDALVSLTYNIGIRAFNRSKLCLKLAKKEFDDVPEEIRKWNKVNRRVSEGLKRRRERESEVFTFGW